jgi:hypothetical protein
MDASRTKSFSHLAANLSWVCPVITVIIFVFLMFSRQVVPRRVIALVATGALCLLVIGLIFGIVALFSISRHGMKGILAPAIVGVIVNGLLLSFVVASFVTSRARMQRHSGIETPPIVAVRVNQALHRMSARRSR